MFVDLHLHADGISDADLATLAYFGLKAAVTCARDAGAGSAAELRKHWDELVHVQTQRLKMARIRPLVALALHPARIPWHGVDELLSRLPHYFDDPKVVALGELGLQEGTEREEDIFSRQLVIAAQLQRPVIVHTPSKDKLLRTKRLLSLLQDSPLEPARVLIDHVSDETFPLVRGFGCWAGLTLQPGGIEPEAAAALISRHGADQLVLTSDIGEGATDLLALPKAAEALRKAGLSDELCRRALSEGPLAFLTCG
jgi:predicted metal-dependent TIM-barrel fold hydrolase